MQVPEKVQTLGGTILLEGFALASAIGTINTLEAGSQNSPLRILVGALGTAALAGSGGIMWKQFHSIRDRPD